MYQYDGDVKSYIIPCYVASNGEHIEKSEKLEYSVHNTLYLSVVCPIVKPELIILTNESKPYVDFGSVAIGFKCVKTIAIQNIADCPLNVNFKILNYLKNLII